MTGPIRDFSLSAPAPPGSMAIKWHHNLQDSLPQSLIPGAISGLALEPLLSPVPDQGMGTPVAQPLLTGDGTGMMNFPGTPPLQFVTGELTSQTRFTSGHDGNTASPDFQETKAAESHHPCEWTGMDQQSSAASVLAQVFPRSTAGSGKYIRKGEACFWCRLSNRKCEREPGESCYLCTKSQKKPPTQGPWMGIRKKCVQTRSKLSKKVEAKIQEWEVKYGWKVEEDGKKVGANRKKRNASAAGIETSLRPAKKLRGPRPASYTLRPRP